MVQPRTMRLVKVPHVTGEMAHVTGAVGREVVETRGHVTGVRAHRTGHVIGAVDRGIVGMRGHVTGGRAHRTGHVIGAAGRGIVGMIGHVTGALARLTGVGEAEEEVMGIVAETGQDPGQGRGEGQEGGVGRDREKGGGGKGGEGTAQGHVIGAELLPKIEAICCVKPR